MRLGDLDPSYLRFPGSRKMVAFAEMLYHATNTNAPPRGAYFTWVWEEAGIL